MSMKERSKYYEFGNSLTDFGHVEYLSKHKPKYLYQYKQGSERNYENLLNQKVWLSFPLYLNDPFEYEYGAYSNGVLISCFTEKYDSLLMWSHYANGHSGFCIKYKFDDIWNCFNSSLFPVIYGSERFKPVLKDSGNAGEIISTFSHKASEWKYEKEWRVIKLISIVDKNFPNLHAQKGELSDMAKPVEIIMGCHYYDNDNKFKLAKYCKENNIVLYRMHMKDSEYQLYKRKQQFSWYDPPEDNLDDYIKEYLRTDVAKRDMKKMEELENKYQKVLNDKMKNYL